ncbi:hypothetical protein P0D87_16240 [Paraburkholderia sp. RL17-368-BIF-A]|uniref:hypothetical protein n=1 Tax=Paraburkholderia sp. RL17-368-BIF-A TaxID=3031628 RepID=UPI0038C5CBF6
MNTSIAYSSPGVNAKFVPVTTEVLERLDDAELRTKLRVGDILTCAEDGHVTGFWREM